MTAFEVALCCPSAQNILSPWTAPCRQLPPPARGPQPATPTAIPSQQVLRPWTCLAQSRQSVSVTQYFLGSLKEHVAMMTLPCCPLPTALRPNRVSCFSHARPPSCPFHTRGLLCRSQRFSKGGRFCTLGDILCPLRASFSAGCCLLSIWHTVGCSIKICRLNV